MLLKAEKLKNKLIAWRRDIHAHPELGFEEIRTAAMVAENLQRMGWKVRTRVGKTGVVAEISKHSDRKSIVALRADMDALPITEANDVPYKSCNPGKMHACGHDAHTAILLGTAELLSEEDFPGTIRLLFQPSEECGDEEGISGAMRMIQDGAMDGVDMIFALHVDPSTPVGTIGISSGPSSGGVDTFFGSIIGKGGHGARPHEAIDPFYLSAFVILAINGIFSRRIDPFDPNVVSLGSIHGGQASNVIPDFVDLSGTIRYTQKRVQEKLHAEIRQAFEMVRPLGGDYRLNFEIGLPPMINHPEATEYIRSAAESIIGKSKLKPLEKELGAEDFGLLSNHSPGAMFVLGTKIENDQRFGHNPRFDIDENALPIGSAILAQTALDFLQDKSKI